MAVVVVEYVTLHDRVTRMSDVQDTNEQQVVVVKCNQPVE